MSMEPLKLEDFFQWNPQPEETGVTSSANGHHDGLRTLKLEDVYSGKDGLVKMAYEQLAGLSRNPLHEGALTIAELDVGRAFAVMGSYSGGVDHQLYQAGYVRSEPYFSHDNMWWIDVELIDVGGRKLPSSLRKGCLGIWGVTMNDRLEWNPNYYVIAA